MNQEGTYYIIYTANDLKFKGIQKIKYIYVLNMEESGESVEGDINGGSDE